MQTNEHNKSTVGIFLAIVGPVLIIAGVFTLAYISVNGGILVTALGAITQGIATGIALTRRVELAPHTHEGLAPADHDHPVMNHRHNMEGDVETESTRRY